MTPIRSGSRTASATTNEPGAIKTGVEALDECHIITHHAGTAAVVEAIKAGLEQERARRSGSSGSSQEDAVEAGHGICQINRRPDFASTKIYLPKVMVLDGGQVRELDYETDVLSRIDWRGFHQNSVRRAISELTVALPRSSS